MARGEHDRLRVGIHALITVLIIAPVILFALTANRYIVSGMTAGAVKG